MQPTQGLFLSPCPVAMGTGPSIKDVREIGRGGGVGWFANFRQNRTREGGFQNFRCLKTISKLSNFSILPLQPVQCVSF